MSELANTTPVDTIERLCATLSRLGVTVEDVAEELGTETWRREVDGHTAVRPHDDRFDDAVIVGDVENPSEPDHVVLPLARHAELPLRYLDAAFGRGRRVPRPPESRESRVAFRVDLPEEPYTCVVFASTTAAESDGADEVVTRITVRRDART